MERKEPQGVKLENITKIYQDPKTKKDFAAVDNVTLDIKPGSFVTLLGPSGCGKTTTLRMIAGFESPDHGEIYLGSKAINELMPNKRDTAMVFQSYALLPHYNVFDNIAYGLKLRKLPKEEIKKQVFDMLDLVELTGMEERMTNQLSGGQQQRVALARALVMQPGVLLFDEPLSNLDAKLRVTMRTEIRKIQQKLGITAIYVTHDQSEALAVSDRIAIMNKGNVLQIGTPFEVYESPATQFVAQFIGETNLFESTVVKCEGYKAKTGEEYMVTLNTPALGMQAQLTGDTQATKEEDKNILVTDYEHTDEGQKVAFTIRPEKIRITLEEPNVNGRKDINVFKGVVEEPVYTGFQSKFYVRLENGTIVKVFKQHTNYLDDGPEIQWKDTVYISWSAEDGYIVENINK
mgnify:CR=1 FL=1